MSSGKPSASSVFKAYDVRGVYPTEIDEKLAWRIGAALVKLLDAKRLVVGRDMRKSAPSIQKAVIDGVTAHGCDVVDIGLVSTPMAYFGIGSIASDGGLTTTASHNPPQYIGAKFCRAGAVPMSKDTGIDERGERVGADLVTALLAQEFLAKEKGAAIVYDLRASRVLPEEIVRLGGRPLRERVGHSFIKATMRRENAPFAGELSGHFYFRDHYFSDCGTLAMVHV